ncbi:hypothetical protein WA026_008263 [Henosepilachna vigintioctopunctata]|uniref:Uncharacterized protein n=1 Tax=Henosepilachna vigintioctopunctata TaxID=420089 RepID=A0AAW1TSE2_9CUCU
MERNTYGESCSLDRISYISLTAKQGMTDITSPLEITAVEVDSWDDLQQKILDVFNKRVRNEEKHLKILYKNNLFSRHSSDSSINGSEDSGEDMYEEIVNMFSLATHEEAELVVLPDKTKWKKMWKHLKGIFRIKRRENTESS